MSTPPPAAPATPDDLNRYFVEFAPDMMVLLNPDGTWRHASSACLSVMGRPSGALVGTNMRELVWDSDQHLLSDLLTELGSGATSAAASFRLHCGFGHWMWMEAHGRRLPAGAGMLLSLRDITIRKEEEAVLIEANHLLRRRATQDPVTCLPNRGHFVASLERELRRAHREGLSLGLLAIGIDEMRLFNDFYGRDAGDVAMREVAVAVEGGLSRPGDLVGRMQGAMLGVMLPNTDLAGTAAVADRMRQVLGALNIEHAGAPAGRLTATVALSCSESRTTAEALLRDATAEVEVVRAASAASALPA